MTTSAEVRICLRVTLRTLVARLLSNRQMKRNPCKFIPSSFNIFIFSGAFYDLSFWMSSLAWTLVGDAKENAAAQTNRFNRLNIMICS